MQSKSMQMVFRRSQIRHTSQKPRQLRFTLGSTATADWGVEDVVLQLATTSGVVMQLNGIAESPCENKTQSVYQ